MRIDAFDYELPPERIAQTPIEPRDAARLLVDTGDTAPEHRHVRDLPQLLGPGDLVVMNRSKVLAARLALRKPTGGEVEVLLLEPEVMTPGAWKALVRPSRRVAPGTILTTGDIEVRADDAVDSGVRRVFVRRRGVAVTAETADRDLAGHGTMPLPPYITTTLDDPSRYQTVFASEPGSAAAPTAGLHLTADLLDRIRATGARTAEVELHVGLDTFRPVTVEDTDDHEMHTERFVVAAEVLEACERAERVIAIGTTTVRALESAALGKDGRTNLFIHDPWEWKIVDVLLTNFHLPKSTLLMMIHAFVGDRWRDLYDDAIEHGYRFLSFGDAMLLDRRAR